MARPLHVFPELQEAIVRLETPKASKQFMYHITQPGILFHRPM